MSEFMSELWAWISANKNWLFEGGGVALLVGVGTVARYVYVKMRNRRQLEGSSASLLNAPGAGTSQQGTQSGVNVTVNPVFNNTPQVDQQRRVAEAQPSQLPNIEYRSFRVVEIPLDLDDNNLGQEHFNENSLNVYQSVVRVLLLRFYYKPEANAPTSIYVKAHIFFEGQRDVFKATWYREQLEVKTFTPSEAFELILGILPRRKATPLGTYEHDRKYRENTFSQYDFFIPDINQLEGSDFNIKVELICKRVNTVLNTLSFNFRLNTKPKPILEKVE